MNKNSMFSGLASGTKWLFFRMPPAFGISFSLISILWAFYGFHYANEYIATPMANLADAAVDAWPDSHLKTLLFSDLHLKDIGGLIFAFVTLLCCFVGFVAAYNLSMLVNALVFKLPPLPLNYRAGFISVPPKPGPPRAPFSESTRIGIVLAGGGAKGAYQAGAMKAIYEFLDHHRALGNVKVISGTSVGSWNAMFWLAGMIKSPKASSEPSCHEWWWKRLKARYIVAPRFFIPGMHNAFLFSDPWQRQFDQIFGSEQVKDHLFNTDIHFYLTRSNVRSGGLECVTNNPSPKAVNRVRYFKLKPPEDPDEGEPADNSTEVVKIKRNQYFERMKTAVFASMDLPPLFPYMPSDYELYEDGGVIDNLPISFPAAEQCNLIFVLPLNSDFEQEPNNRSLFVRIGRVIDVQQGALERHGFKLLYLYNENAALRERIKELSPDEAKKKEDGVEQDQSNRLQPYEYAMQRKHKAIQIFAVCPDKSFVKSTLDTRDLWNTEGARIAFDVMYNTTAELLGEYGFGETQKSAHVALIRRAGSYIFDHDF